MGCHDPSFTPGHHPAAASLEPGRLVSAREVTPLVYKELHRLAHRYMGFESPGQTLQTSALVNEAYLQLVSNQATWQNRAQFFAISAQLMRQILVDFARSRHQLKARRKGAAGFPL
jgi:hypothetical protein